MIKILSLFLLSFVLLFSTQFVFAENSNETLCTENCSNLDDEQNLSDPEKPKFYKIIEPDIHIDFSDDSHWEGLPTNSDYWQIRNGEGYFMLYSGIQQLNSATYDLLPSLDSEIGTEWVLRYKLSFDNYKQGTDSKWSELLIGLHNESISGLTPQWGLGVGFLNGDAIKFTNLMYDFGTYNDWHCCPMKGKFENENSLPGKNKTWWIEYVKDEKKLTVKIFEDKNYQKLVEQKSVSGWEPNELRYLKIFPLVEENSVNGFMSGSIDDIKFYNDEISVYAPDKKPLPESLKSKTMDEMLKDALGDEYDEPLTEEFNAEISDEFKDTVLLWSNGKIPDTAFYSKVKNSVINEKMLIEELSRAYGQKLDLTYKPQTIMLPDDKKCDSCIIEDFIELEWKLPNGLPENASAVIEIITPSNENIRLTTSSKTGSTFRITSEFSPGIYEIFVTYANQKFSISPILLTDQPIPKIPFWVKYNSAKWVNGELPENEFIDSLIYLIQNGEITFNYEIFTKKEVKEILTPQEKLEIFFPTPHEIKKISPKLPPPIWEYIVTSDALRLVNMDFVSVQKVLEDKTRVYDPIYEKYDVPFTMMQIYEFDSKQTAQEFIEEQIFVNNVFLEGNISEDELAYSDYRYNRIFENADMSGTSETTGDCLYNMIPNSSNMMLDETHFLQCVLDEKIIQIYVSEDYTVVDETFLFALMDTILKKINKSTDIQSVEHVLTLDNIVESKSSPQTSPQTSPQNLDANDPEISGTSIGINNFVCKKDDFGTINMLGQFVNGENSFDQVKISIVIESYDGVVLASGHDYVLKINPFETRTIDGYVFVNEPFHKCHASVDWNNSK